LIGAHDAGGAFGLVLNRPLSANVQPVLAQWSWPIAEPAVVFNGGPVDASAVFVVGHGARVPDHEWASLLLPTVGLLEMDRVPEAMSTGVEAVRVFSGSAGWVSGQLESEIAGEAWFVVDAEPADVFSTRPERLWHEVLRRQPGSLAMFAFFPNDPAMN
jgi:putative transcriptional regulator